MSLPPNDQPIGRIAHAFVVVSNAVAYESFSGRTLVDRHLAILARAGVSDARIVTSADWPDMQQQTSEWPGRRLVICAERVFDPGLYAHALAQPGGVSIRDRGAPIGLDTTDRGQETVPLEIAALPPCRRDLGRRVLPYWMRVDSARERPAVARMLVEASGRGQRDLAATLLNAPIENALMRRLADTAITPNQLTLLWNIVAGVVILLLARGHFLSGALAALAVGVLDGLDGRQARIQIRSRAVGRGQRLLDTLYEILWMAALAYGLSAGFTTGHYGRGVWIFVAADLTGVASYGIVKWRTGVPLDEVSSTDRFIGLFAGHRNVYAWVLLGCGLAGQPGRAFALILWWSLVTAATHGQRAISIVVHGAAESATADRPS